MHYKMFSKFEKNPIRLVRIMAIFISGVKRILMGEEKYEENKTNFEGVYLSKMAGPI